jgi:hypothetical protein
MGGDDPEATNGVRVKRTNPAMTAKTNLRTRAVKARAMVQARMIQAVKKRAAMKSTVVTKTAASD